MPWPADFVVDYNLRTFRHVPGATTIYSGLTQYSELADLFDDLNQMDNPNPMTAQTPTEFTLEGGWFQDPDSLQYINGAAIQSSGWASGEIRAISYDNSGASDPFNEGDIGRQIRGATTGDTGKILHFDQRYGTDLGVVWIRPDDPATDVFDNATESFDGGVDQRFGGAVSEDISGAPFTDETDDFASAATGDVVLIPATPQVNDAFYMGSPRQFTRAGIDVGTAASDGAVTWEYWDGDSWEALGGVTDDTTGFTVSGVNEVTFDLPTDWATTTVNSQGPFYWIRARVTTAGTTAATGDEGYVSIRGDGAFTSTLDAGGSITGETIYSNFFTGPNLGVLSEQVAGTPDSKTYAVQNQGDVGGLADYTVLAEHASATETNTALGSLGDIDILVKTQELGVIINSGRVQMYNRKEGALYANGEATAVGGRTPIVLNTANDLNHINGRRQFDGSGGSGNFTVGEVFTVGGVVRGYITAVGADSNDTTDWFPLGPKTDLVATDVVTGVSSGATTTVDTDVAINSDAAPDNTITTNFGSISRDLNNGDGPKNYSVEVDCQALPFADVYERLKFVCARGETTDIDTPGGSLGVTGEQYLGEQLVLTYGTGGGTPAIVGEIVTGQTSGATAIVMADHGDGTDGDLILTAVNGTFTGTEQILGDTAFDGDRVSSVTVVPVSSSPFVTRAGTLMIGAQGVWFADIAVGEEQNIQLTADDGSTQNPPNTVSVVVTSLVVGDSVGMFRVDTNGDVLKTDAQPGATDGEGVFNSHASLNVQGDLTFETTTAIEQSNPDGTNALGASIRVIDQGLGLEDRYRYSSFSGTTFTLTVVDDSSGSLTASTDDDSAHNSGATWDTGATVPVLVGDIFRNITRDAVSYVAEVVSDTELTLDPPITGQVSTDTYEINRLVRNYFADDDAYVPLIDRKAAATSESNKIIKTLGAGGDIDFLYRVRFSGASNPIEAFEGTGTVGDTGISVAAIRNPDTIAT